MIKHLALLTLFATPFLAHGQEEPAAAATRVPVVPLVTYDLVGTFPANAPTRWLMAPGSSFLLEVSFPQSVPAFTNGTFSLDAPAVGGTYSFQGRTYPVTSGLYTVHAHALNYSALRVTTPAGTLLFQSGGTVADIYPAHPVELPITINRIPNADGTVTFLAVDAGNQGNWPCTFTNRWGQQFVSSANVLDVTGRLVIPKPRPLATR